MQQSLNAKTDLQKSKTQPKKDILFGNVNQLIFDLYCSVDTSEIKTITEYLIKEYPLHQISNILEFLMQEYEEVKTSQKNKAYEEKLQEILVGTVEFQICFNFLLVLRRNFGYF